MCQTQRIVDRLRHSAGSYKINKCETGANQRLYKQHVDVRNDEIRRVNNDIDTLMGRSTPE